jgi:hypothetical protein
MIHDIIEIRKEFKIHLQKELDKFFKTKTLSIILNESSDFFLQYQLYKKFLLKEHQIKVNKNNIKKKLDTISKEAKFDKKTIYTLQYELSHEIEALNNFNISKKNKIQSLQELQNKHLFIISTKILNYEIKNNSFFNQEFYKMKKHDSYLISYCKSWKEIELQNLGELKNELPNIKELLLELINLTQLSLSKETLDGQLKDHIFSQMSFQANLNLDAKNLYFYNLLLEYKNKYPSLLNNIYFQKFQLVEDSTHLVNFGSSNNLKKSLQQKYKLQKYLSYLFKFQYFFNNTILEIDNQYAQTYQQKVILLKAATTSEKFSHYIISKWISHYIEEFKKIGD